MNNQELTLNLYQQKAMSTCMPTSANFSYMFLNLVGEIGEFSSKVAKAIRKGWCTIENGECVWLTENASEQRLKEIEALKHDLIGEAGDQLWQLAGLCAVFGWTLGEIGQSNLDKLHSRQERGVIDGNGDNR